MSSLTFQTNFWLEALFFWPLAALFLYHLGTELDLEDAVGGFEVGIPEPFITVSLQKKMRMAFCI